MEKQKQPKTSLELATLAIEADERKLYSRAVNFYTLAIEKLLGEVKSTQNEAEKNGKLKQVAQYMERAEYVKSNFITKREPVKLSRRPIPALKNVKPRPSQAKPAKEKDKYALMILDEVVDKSPGVKWSDIAGLDTAKQVLQEAVILPTLRPDIFVGLRSPPKGVLLFGPPGTGKTLLGTVVNDLAMNQRHNSHISAKAVATESDATFFSISASSLTSKWVGEGEKLVRALFQMARELQPSVVFIDEIDSLLSSRSSNEHDATRRMKNQFLVELDGATTSSTSENRVLVMGATNLPYELDEAVIRRLEKRIYVPLPSSVSRAALIRQLLSLQTSNMSDRDLNRVAAATEGYSGSDLYHLCKEAALGPIRGLDSAALRRTKAEEIRGVTLRDFENSLKRIRSSINPETLRRLEDWNRLYGGTG